MFLHYIDQFYLGGRSLHKYSALICLWSMQQTTMLLFIAFSWSLHNILRILLLWIIIWQVHGELQDWAENWQLFHILLIFAILPSSGGLLYWWLLSLVSDIRQTFNLGFGLIVKKKYLDLIKCLCNILVYFSCHSGPQIKFQDKKLFLLAWLLSQCSNFNYINLLIPGTWKWKTK